MLRKNSTSYPLNLSRQIDKLFIDYKKIDKPFLLFHQYMIREIFTHPIFGIGERDNPRGILINHGVGTGKTLTAVSLLIALLDYRTPVILVAKSLQQNFLDNIDKFIEDKNIAETIKSRITFVSLDAFNSAQQMKVKSGTLNHKLLIIDEAHNFFKAVINSGEGSTNAKTLYEMIMGAIDLRIIFLSGTPIVKDPFELVCAVNMLMGKELLPSNYETFQSQYILNKRHLKNKEKLQNRLFGLISYIRFDLPMYPGDEKKEDHGKPKDLGIKVERVEMSEAQYIRYISIRDKEEKTARRRKSKSGSSSLRIRDTAPMSLPSSGKGGSSYFIESRMVSNFSLPLDLLKEDTRTIDKKFFTKENSPKIYRVVQNIKKGKKPALLYSQFIQGGIDVVAEFLKLEGYEEWKPEDFGKPIIYKLRYAIIAGRVPPKSRPLIIKTFNNPSNMYGDNIAILMVSVTGAEGLDLKNVREVHILEPYWDMARIIQIQGRAIRKDSHLSLPENQRDVQTIIYTSVENKASVEKIKFKEDSSIDIQFLDRSIRKMKLIKEFDKAIEQISIECISYNYENCKVCLPNNAILYHITDVKADINIPDPCQEYTYEDKLTVKKITFNDTEYFYKKNNDSPIGYNFYIYNKELDGHTEVPLNNKIIYELIKLIK